jgi:hypothetical protein
MTKRVITDSSVCLQDILYGVDDLSVKTKTKNKIFYMVHSLPKKKKRHVQQCIARNYGYKLLRKLQSGWQCQ